MGIISIRWNTFEIVVHVCSIWKALIREEYVKRTYMVYGGVQRGCKYVTF